jgi:hypothetical protein
MRRQLTASAICVVIAIGLGACGDSSDNDNPAGPSGTLPQLIVNYVGFVGQSFSTSDPTPCPTSACAIAAPTQIPRQPGSFSYRVSPGTYRIDGTLVGRPAPLTPPATNVSASLSFLFGWEIVSTLTLLGIDQNSLRMNGNPVSPNDAGGTGVGCGRFLESFTPSQVIQWSFTFTIQQYTVRPANICV